MFTIRKTDKSDFSYHLIGEDGYDEGEFYREDGKWWFYYPDACLFSPERAQFIAETLKNLEAKYRRKQ